MTVFIHDGNRADSCGAKPTFDTADEELVLQVSIVLKYGTVVVHMMRCATILDPNSANLLNRSIDRCFVAVCEPTEYSSVCCAIVRITVSVGVATSTIVATSTVGTT